MGANHFLDAVRQPRAAGASRFDIEVEATWPYTGRVLTRRRIGHFVIRNHFIRRRQAMKERVGSRMLYFFILLFLLSGCAPSRVYTEGVLAKDYRTMSTDELQRYSLTLQDEIVRVEKGGPLPASATRENYLTDLRSTRYDVQRQIEDRKAMLLEEQKGRSDQRSPFALP
jgi:hypothetical protein